MSAPKPSPLAVTMGDPSGCGPQITARAWQARADHSLSPFLVIGDPAIYCDLCETEIIDSPAESLKVFQNALPVLPLGNALPREVIAGRPDTDFAPAILQSIETTVDLTLRGETAGVVTNPISKAVLYKSGFGHPGHTEFIAALCEGRTGETCKPVMMLVGGGLRVALATIHVPLMSVAALITTERLSDVAIITEKALRERFGLPSPRIAFTGLNPHAGEDGTIGREEQAIINPAAEKLRERGLNISDARPADTVFHEALNGQFDAVIAMTHDQGLIPVKTLDMWGGVNTTLGLPIIRTSPDHGTAYEAAAKGTARADSLIAALKLAETMAGNRQKTRT